MGSQYLHHIHLPASILDSLFGSPVSRYTSLLPSGCFDCPELCHLVIKMAYFYWSSSYCM
jgi:hypothetical protein